MDEERLKKFKHFGENEYMNTLSSKILGTNSSYIVTDDIFDGKQAIKQFKEKKRIIFIFYSLFCLSFFLSLRSFCTFECASKGIVSFSFFFGKHLSFLQPYSSIRQFILSYIIACLPFSLFKIFCKQPFFVVYHHNGCYERPATMI